MSSAIELLTVYLSYPFARYALIVGTLIALCSSLLGVTLVMKQYSFIGDSLSHVAFCATAFAGVLQFGNEMLFTLPATVIFAVLVLRFGKSCRGSGDAMLAMISVGSLALGYLLVNLFSKSANLTADVCGVLFGSASILTLKPAEVWLSIVLSVFVVVFFVLFYNRIFALTFDETFACVCGTDTKLYQTLISVVIAVIIVLSMRLVGSLLISALIIFPALSAMQLFNTFKATTIGSSVISVLSAAVGLLVAILTGTPVGATIVAVDIVAFILCFVIRVIRR